MTDLAFTYYGPLTSNNRTTRRFGNRSVKSAEAVRDQARIYQIAWAESQRIGWKMPEAAVLHIIAWNTRKDVGNIEKCIADGLIGVAYSDDRILTSLLVFKQVDHAGERYDVTVVAAPLLVRPKKVRARREPRTTAKAVKS